MSDALMVQCEDLVRYRYILKPEIMQLLTDRALYMNKKTKDPYEVWRGTDIDQFVAAISYNLSRGKKLSDLTHKDNFATLLFK